jgi:hypothetical protein
VAASAVTVSGTGVTLRGGAAALCWNNPSSGNPLLILHWSAVRQMPKGSFCPAMGGIAMKTFWALCLALAVLCGGGLAAFAADQGPPPPPNFTPVPPEGIPQFTYSWQTLPLLPRRLQNHCGFFRGQYVCADHCGPSYQVYFCSPVSIGCCHVGQGYCGGDGGVRCGTWPWVFPFL